MVVVEWWGDPPSRRAYGPFWTFDKMRDPLNSRRGRKGGWSPPAKYHWTTRTTRPPDHSTTRPHRSTAGQLGQSGIVRFGYVKIWKYRIFELSEFEVGSPILKYQAARILPEGVSSRRGRAETRSAPIYRLPVLHLVAAPQAKTRRLDDLDGRIPTKTLGRHDLGDGGHAIL